MSAVLRDNLAQLRDMQEADVPAVMAIERVAYEACRRMDIGSFVRGGVIVPGGGAPLLPWIKLA